VHPRDYADPVVGAGTAAAIRLRSGTAVEGFHSDAVDVFRLRDADTAAGESRPETGGTRLRLADFHADASDAADRLALAFDGDADTRWLTGRQQNGDEWIALQFDRPRDVSRIELQTALRSFGDYPRELVIESAGGDGARSVLYRGSMLVPFGRALAQGGPHPVLAISLPSNRTRTLTIRQTGRTRRWFWSVHELSVWER
jgi:hypothetical protein